MGWTENDCVISSSVEVVLLKLWVAVKLAETLTLAEANNPPAFDSASMLRVSSNVWVSVWVVPRLVVRVCVVSLPPAEAGSRPLPLGPYPSASGTGGGRLGVREAFPSQPISEATSATPTRWGRYIGQYRETYLVLEDPEGLVLIDQHVAHERVLFERLLETASKPAVQGLLLPEIVELPPALAVLAVETAAALESLGLELEPASGTTVRVLGVPAALPAGRAAETVRQLLSDLAGRETPGESLRERAAASLACQAAVKKNRPLSRAEAEHLLAELAEVRDPHRCPHGRPIVLRLSHPEIERLVGRR